MEIYHAHLTIRDCCALYRLVLQSFSLMVSTLLHASGHSAQYVQSAGHCQPNGTAQALGTGYPPPRAEPKSSSKAWGCAHLTRAVLMASPEEDRLALGSHSAVNVKGGIC